MEKKDIVVVIPVYKNVLSPQEEISLKQCVQVLADYPLVIMKPIHLDVKDLLAKYPSLQIVDFPDECFASLSAYNKLVLDPDFYARFSSYVYLLIYQLDAYVFRDELLDWAQKGYDYIGAPWLPIKKNHPKRGWFSSLKRRYYRFTHNSEKLQRPKYIEYEVGNGGLSLRKIDKMIQVTQHYQLHIANLLADDQPFYPEDALLWVEVRNRAYQLSRPSYQEAMFFALELGADWAYEEMGHRLPFGCHAWYHPDSYPFWAAFIRG